MGISAAIDRFVQGLQNTVMFVITYTLFIFIAGEWYGTRYQAEPMFWWPVYLLAFSLVIYIVIDLSASGTKK